jgi:AraC-like DNA-binding protein
MAYREYPVPKALRRHVQCVWRLQAPPHGPQNIFADGRCEVILHFGEPPSAWSAEHGWQRQAPLLFAAQHRGAIRLASEHRLDCVGIRLRPSASAAIAASRLAELRDRIVDLSTLTAEFATALGAGAVRFTVDPADPEFWALLEAQLSSHPINGRIEAAVATLESKAGQISVAATAAAAAMSIRALQTRFLECVGLSVKEFARILRLQALIRSLDERSEPLSQLAAEAGFSDQPHATRELRRLTGSTPALLRQSLQQNRDGEDALRLAAAFIRGYD